jgi:hypothetical protein
LEIETKKSHPPLLAQIEEESPEQKKPVFLVVKKRLKEALFTTLEILVFL